jgi:endonuclease YncB( thermonuclease family)
MASPGYLAISGKFVIVDKEPDGDSVRFIADDVSLYQRLQNAYRIHLSQDESVQLRFEGVDAPELHYGTASQPLGAVARDALLNWMGFKNIVYKNNHSTMVASADPAQGIRGGILTNMAEANGRPVSYVLLEKEMKDFKSGTWVLLDEDAVRADLLSKTLNNRLLEEGMAYYTVYTSMPREHRRFLRKTVAIARKSKKGVWEDDLTSDFILENQSSIDHNGQLILPKLFRRCTDYLKAVAQGFQGELVDWMIAHEQGTRSENDEVIINDSLETNPIVVRFSDLIDQRNRHIVFKADLLDIAFVEK